MATGSTHMPILKAYTALGAEHTTRPKEAALRPFTSRSEEYYGKVGGVRGAAEGFANTQAQLLLERACLLESQPIYKRDKMEWEAGLSGG